MRVISYGEGENIGGKREGKAGNVSAGKQEQLHLLVGESDN